MTRRFWADQRGVSAVEFAICLPFIVLLYLGGYQLSDSISAYRKVTAATRTVADLTSQSTSVTASDLDTILNASTQILSPYKISAAKLTVSQIYTDPNGVSTVDWSRGLNINALTKGTSFTLPGTIKQNGTYVIVASINYTYTPVAGLALLGSIPMHDQIIMSPRASNSVTGVNVS